MANYNLPLPSAEIREGSSYTIRNGLDNDSVKVIPVVFSHDGTGLKPGCQMAQWVRELVGATVRIDIEYVKSNPAPDPAELRSLLVTEASVGVASTLDGKIRDPFSVEYVTPKKNLLIG